jgi:hypothetical protein
MAKLKLIYTAEGTAPREFVVDMGSPPFPLMRETEQVTDWPWGTFKQRLEDESAIAWQALLWWLRKTNGERGLRLEHVTFDLENEIDFEAECRCGEWVSAEDGDHECPVDEDETGDKVGDVDPEA